MVNMKDFEGKVAVVTGASSGIGRSIAELYGREGASVVVSDIQTDLGMEVVAGIQRAGGKAIFVQADVSNPADCQRIVQAAMDNYGRLDAACNNAGIAGAAAPIADMVIEDWDQVLKINLYGVFYCLKYEIPAMIASGGGSIVNMASILGQVGMPGSAAYVTAKHGLLGLTKNAALEYAQAGIRVNSVGPGFISTPLIAALEENEQTNQMLISKHPIGRLGRPEEIAELVLWLSSKRASFVTGAYYPVDGGYLAQ